MSSTSPPATSTPPSSSSSPLSPALVQHFLDEKTSEGILFSGWYNDRVRVDDRDAYADRVTLDRGETEMAKTIRSMARRAKKMGDGFTRVESKRDIRNDFFISNTK